MSIKWNKGVFSVVKNSPTHREEKTDENLLLDVEKIFGIYNISNNLKDGKTLELKKKLNFFIIIKMSSSTTRLIPKMLSPQDGCREKLTYTETKNIEKKLLEKKLLEMNSVPSSSEDPFRPSSKLTSFPECFPDFSHPLNTPYQSETKVPPDAPPSHAPLFRQKGQDVKGSHRVNPQ